MRKRIICCLMISVLAVSALAGCGKTESIQQSVSEESISQAVSGENDSQTVSEENTSQEGERNMDTELEKTDKKDEVPASEADEVSENTGIPVLKNSVMNTMGCRVGCAATASELADKKVWEIITTHFNALTIGNELKPDAMVGYSCTVCPGTEEAELNGETIIVPKLDYSRAEKMLDKVLAWNQENPENQILVRGHVLVWHAQTPEWFFHVDYDKNKDYVDKETMNKRLEWYIRTMLTHFTGEDSKYKDLFYGWDVVNEAVSDGGGYRTDTQNPNEALSEDRHGSNSSWWHIYQSNEYIINAFIYANKYAPENLELYYNDYNECERVKMLSIAELLTELKEREGAPGEGTRISGMGMQGHYNMSSPGMDKVELAIKTYAKIVGNVQITEFDLKASDGYDGSDEAKEEEYEKQATRYRVLYWVMKNQNKQEGTNITGITFWGTVDHYSWLQSHSNVGGGNTGNLNQCPLLFDENYEPKPAFYVFAGEEK